MVRIYPDQIFMVNHRTELTPDEIAAGESWDFQAPLDTQREMWRTLSHRFGPRRASWIIHQSGLSPETDSQQASVLEVLPSRFVVYVYQHAADDEPKYSTTGADIDPQILKNVSPFSFASEATDGVFPEWFFDFSAAESAGMAVTIPLKEKGPDIRFERIIAVGIKETDSFEGRNQLKNLLDAHHYSRGLAFVEPGTPTNNTAGTRSDFSPSEEDHESSFDIEVLGPANWNVSVPPNSYAQRSGCALGLVDEYFEVLRYLQRAGSQRDTSAEDMQTVLWPALGDFMLGYMLRGSCPESQVKDEARLSLSRHFREHVRAAGSLPTLRFGKLPYGLLPVTQFKAWEPERYSESAMYEYQIYEKSLHSLLLKFFDLWSQRANDPDCVPRIGENDDADEELSQILGMAAVSNSLQSRIFLDYSLVQELPDLFEDRSHYADTELAGNIATLSHHIRDQARLLLTLGRFEREDPSLEECFKNMPLFQSIGWQETVPIHGKLADKEGRDLHALCNNSTSPANRTLLYELADRSRRLLDTWSHLGSQSGWLGEKTRVENAICRLAHRFGATPVGDVGTEPEQLSTPPPIDRLFREVLDLCTHRLDAWITSFATKRLAQMRDRVPDGLYLGAYGWVEDFKHIPLASDGFLFAPSSSQGAAGAVLHNVFLGEQERQEKLGKGNGDRNPYRINLTSGRVQKAMRLLDGVREGHELAELLGSRFERALHGDSVSLDRYIDEFRNAFPLVANRIPETESEALATAIAARNVVDGLALLRAWMVLRASDSGTSLDLNELHERLSNLPTAAENPRRYQGLRRALDLLADLRDASSDLLMTEAVYQTVRGNHERAGAALEAVSGNLHPPEIESMKTPVSGTRLNHRVCVLLAPATAADRHMCTPRGTAEPRLEAWLARILGDPAQVACKATYTRAVSGATVTRDVTLADLNIGALDLLYMSHEMPGPETTSTEIEQRIAYFLRDQDPLLEYNTAVTIDFERSSTGHNRTITEALQLVDAIHEMIGDGVALRPTMLANPSVDHQADYSSDDILELRGRIDLVFRDVRWLVSVLSREQKASIECRMPVIAAALLLASQYGVFGVVPAGPVDPELDSLRKMAVTELDSRAQKCQAVLTEVDGLEARSRDTIMKKLTEAMQALFGAGFIVLPQFSPADRASLEQALNAPETLAGINQHRIRLWVQQAAQIRQPLAHLDDAMMALEAWTFAAEDEAITEPLPEFQLVQHLPDNGKPEPWLALDDSERGQKPRPQHALSLLALTPAALSREIPDNMVGILIDQWDELIPHKEINSSLTFQYNRPGAQAPNCLLLAVPPLLGPEPEPWSVDTIRDIVSETLDLAKVRAVDLDALPDVGGVLPGIFAPTSKTDLFGKRHVKPPLNR